MEMLIERRTLPPGRLQQLVKGGVYREKYKNLFPTRDSWRHFLRSRRSELERRELIWELSSGIYVDAVAMDAALPGLLAPTPLA